MLMPMLMLMLSEESQLEKKFLLYIIIIIVKFPRHLKKTIGCVWEIGFVWQQLYLSIVRHQKFDLFAMSPDILVISYSLLVAITYLLHILHFYIFLHSS